MSRRAKFPLLAVPILIALGACSESTTVPGGARAVPASADAAKSSGGAARTTPVTSSIADDAGFQLKSDGAGPYRNSSTLVSEIQSGTDGDWILSSYLPANSTRTVYLDFSRPIAGSGPNGGDPVAIPSGLYKFQMLARCHLVGIDFGTLAAGQTVHCPFHVGQVFVGTKQYLVMMNPGPTTDGFTWPETNYANVTCNTIAGACASWTISPSGTAPDGSAANVTALIEIVTSTSKGKSTTTDVKQGDFYMSFRIDVTSP